MTTTYDIATLDKETLFDFLRTHASVCGDEAEAAELAEDIVVKFNGHTIK